MHSPLVMRILQALQVDVECPQLVLHYDHQAEAHLLPEKEHWGQTEHLNALPVHHSNLVENLEVQELDNLAWALGNMVGFSSKTSCSSKSTYQTHEPSPHIGHVT